MAGKIKGEVKTAEAFIHETASYWLCVLTGYSPLNTQGSGISTGDLKDIYAAAILSCFGSSGKKATKEDETAAKELKPRALIKALLSDKEENRNRAIFLLRDTPASEIRKTILNNAKRLIDTVETIGTHTDKLTNPSAQYGVLISDEDAVRNSVPSHGVCTGTYISRSGISASGNAALNAAMRFLSWSVQGTNGTISLIRAIEQASQETLDYLGEDVSELLSQVNSLSMKGNKRAGNLSPEISHKQLLWPIFFDGHSDSYILLSPVASFAQVGELEARLRATRNGENRKITSKRIITVGSGKPGNIGMLALDASGSFSRLLSTPVEAQSDKDRLVYQIENDAPYLKASLFAKGSKKFFQSAAEHETGQPNAETREKTNKVFRELTRTILDRILLLEDTATAENITPGPVMQKYVRGLLGGEQWLKAEILELIQKYLGGIRVSGNKFIGTDEQNVRILQQIDAAMRGEV